MRRLAAVAAEALRAEVVRHACCRDRAQPRFQSSRIATERTQRDREVVALQRATLQLAPMARGRDDFEALARDAQPCFADRGTGRHRERLLRHSVAVLQAGEADVARIELREPRELFRNPQGIRPALTDFQEQMVAVAVRLPTQPLLHEKVFGCGTQLRAARRTAVRARQRRHLFEYIHGACFPVVCSIRTIA